jgi:hypothetical protein
MTCKFRSFEEFFDNVESVTGKLRLFAFEAVIGL